MVATLRRPPSGRVSRVSRAAWNSAMARSPALMCRSAASPVSRSTRWSRSPVGKGVQGAVGQPLPAGVQLGLGDRGLAGVAGLLGVSTETRRTGWSMTGVSPSETLASVCGAAGRTMRGTSNSGMPSP